MPLDVVLQTLDGKRFDEALATNAALDRVLPVPEDCHSQCCVSSTLRAAPSSMEARCVVSCRDRPVPMVDDQRAGKFLLRVREMAEKCKKEPHTFLRFMGD